MWKYLTTDLPYLILHFDYVNIYYFNVEHNNAEKNHIIHKLTYHKPIKISQQKREPKVTINGTGENGLNPIPNVMKNLKL